MTDDADTVAQKIRKAKTDPHPLPDSIGAMEERPEAANLLGIWAALSDTTIEATVQRFAGRQFSEFKNELTELAVAVLSPINVEMKRLLADPETIDAILRKGGERARALSAPIMKEIRDVVGFLSA